MGDLWGIPGNPSTLALAHYYGNAVPAGTTHLDVSSGETFKKLISLVEDIEGSGRWSARSKAKGCSVGKSHLLRVTQLVQVGVAGQLHHRRWPTEQQQHIIARRWQVLPDHLSSHKALAVVPT